MLGDVNPGNDDGTGTYRLDVPQEHSVMTVDVIREASPFLPLFLPAMRLDRLSKAGRSGADAVIIDLEDAVGESQKASAREALVDTLQGVDSTVPLLVRINASDTKHFDNDLAAVSRCEEIAGIVLPKAEIAAGIEAIRGAIGADRAIVALVETPRGLADARELARLADRLAFGSIDFAGSVGAEEGRETMVPARFELVLAAALAATTGPIDGITRRLDAETAVEDDARHAASLGFAGKLLIHPAQVAPAIRGFAPGAGEVERARGLLEQAGEDATRVGGEMVDRPVLEEARRCLEAHHRAEERLAAIRETGKRNIEPGHA